VVYESWPTFSVLHYIFAGTLSHDYKSVNNVNHGYKGYVVTMKNVIKRQIAEETKDKNGKLSLNELNFMMIMMIMII